MRTWWIRKVLAGVVFGTLFVLLMGWVVMNLWNSILSPVTGAGTLRFGQAIGLFFLFRILTGGFTPPWGGWGHRSGIQKRNWKKRWAAKLSQMSPEEREQWREKYRNMCGYGYKRDRLEKSQKKNESTAINLTKQAT